VWTGPLTRPRLCEAVVVEPLSLTSLWQRHVWLSPITWKRGFRVRTG
jgi:hypothetical protein